MLTKKIIIKGKVQGVFFRQSAKQKAESLGIGGSVENLADGNTVCIIATASEAVLADFINWCQQGPPQAKVDNIEILDLSLQKFENFSIL